MRNFIRMIVIQFLKVIAGLFYDKKYLCGKHFDIYYSGWIWVMKGIWFQKILGFNREIPWPVSARTSIVNHKNIVFSPDDMNNFQSPGCYFQNFEAKIYIGKGTYIGPNVGLITVNHDISNLDNHSEHKNIVLGRDSWIGMNSVILPGVKLGPKTIVAAGAIVTKSYRNGYAILAGNPAKVIKKYPKVNLKN